MIFLYLRIAHMGYTCTRISWSATFPTKPEHAHIEYWRYYVWNGQGGGTEFNLDFVRRLYR